MTKTTATLLAAALMLALGMHDADAASEGDMAPTDKASNQLYWDGQAALKKSDWNGALKRFQVFRPEARRNNRLERVPGTSHPRRSGACAPSRNVELPGTNGGL